MHVIAFLLLSCAPSSSIAIGAANNGAAAASNAARIAAQLAQQEEQSDAEAAASMPSSAFHSRFASCPSRAHDPFGYEECAKIIKREDTNSYLSKDDVVELLFFVAIIIGIILACACAARY